MSTSPAMSTTSGMTGGGTSVSSAGVSTTSAASVGGSGSGTGSAAGGATSTGGANGGMKIGGGGLLESWVLGLVGMFVGLL